MTAILKGLFASEIAAGWITAVSTAIVAITGILALVYAYKQLKQFREAEKVQHLLKLVEQFENAPLANIRNSLAKKRLNEIEEPPELENLLNFFETIGLLVERGYLDEHDVWSSFSYWMFSIFADCRDQIEQEQKADPTYYSEFSKLIERLKQIEHAEGGTAYSPSPEDLEDFLALRIGDHRRNTDDATQATASRQQTHRTQPEPLARLG